MKRVTLVLFVACLATLGLTTAAHQTAEPLNAPSTLEAPNGLPTAPMFLSFEEFQTVFMSGGTCAKIRPVAHGWQCNYSLCEDNGCGAPFYFDEVDCSCYCGYAF